MDKYFSLLSLQVEHQYLGDRKEPVLSFEPTATTLASLHNAGAIFRVTNDGFEIIVTKQGCEILEMLAVEIEPTAENLASGDEELDQPPFLVFKGFAIAPHFGQFTQGNINSGINCFLANNASLSQKSGRLHASDFLDDSSVIILNDSYYKRVLSSNERINTPILIVSLSLKQIIPHTDLHQQAINPYRYTVAFENRKNIWKYLVLGGEKFKNLQVVDLDNNIEFDYHGKESVGNGEFLVFLSTIPIPFHKQSIRRFQLQDINQHDTEPPDEPIVVVEQLPIARVSQGLAKSPAQGDALISEIFVNL